VSPHLRAWLLVLAVILVCGGTWWIVDHNHSRIASSRPSLLARLPAKDAVILEIDFAALRRAGLIAMLGNSKTAEEPEYKQFVAKTEFDYTQDLDLALVSFSPTGKYFLLKGRFDWNRLNAYVASQGGDCYNARCRMNGSAPDRKISFSALRPEIMAMAVSKNDEAVGLLMAMPPEPRTVAAPVEPVALSFSPSGLKSIGALPTGTQIFAKSLEDAQEVILTLGPRGTDFQLTLSARCRTDHDAELLAAELERNTLLLRSMIEREKRTPNPRDLSGVLTSGTFSHDRQRVTGLWPISRGFVEDTLAGGS
jgi:hypothetical protein